MTTLRGDVCPDWCTGSHEPCRETESGFEHPEDQGVYHRLDVDLWHASTEQGLEGDATRVWIEAYRHDHTDDWPDMVEAENVSPGFMGGINLQVQDARRLGEALIRAADLIQDRGAHRVSI